MEASKLVARVGQRAHMAVYDDMDVAVVVKDARHNFGRVDYLVVPVSGRGEAWVQGGRLEWELVEDSA